MKPRNTGLAIVSASLDRVRLAAALQGWESRAQYDLDCYSPIGFGVVPLFAEGVQRALGDGYEVIACLHDDVTIDEDGWDAKVLDFFDWHPACGLLGFGGATGLGDPDIYRKPYDPMQLARRDFVSNMRDAEVHGRRAYGHRGYATHPSDVGPCLMAEPVAVLDGFSLVGRREFWAGVQAPNVSRPGAQVLRYDRKIAAGTAPVFNLFQRMGPIIHHAYDAALGCYAKRLGWEVWMLPIACHHHGGLTAVGDPRYAEWAKTQHPEGDQGFWKQSHEWVYEEFRDCLPIQV